MKKAITLFTLLFSCSLLFAQNKPVGWVSKDVFQTRYFVENKGQYDALQAGGPAIQYGIDNNSDHIYFSPSGFMWLLVKNHDAGEAKDPDAERDPDAEVMKMDSCRLQMNWINANPAVQIIPGEKSKHYFSYGDARYLSYGYQTITYKNLYPGIDIEYTIPEKGGVEYRILLAPGADLSQVKFRYTANRPLHLSADKNGLKIGNSIWPLSEKDMRAFDSQGTEVSMSYVLHGNEVSLQAAPYNYSLALTVDPWITPLTSLAGSGNCDNAGYDVDYDQSGDLFVFGGGGLTSTPYLCKVAKYDPSGSLLWTFDGQVISAGWTTSPVSAYPGNFVVDKNSGKVYISQGFAYNGSQVVRINGAGLYDNFISVANEPLREIWEMKFNCLSGELLGMGGSTNSEEDFGIIDTTTGNVVTSNITAISTSYQQDIVNCTMDGQGHPYMIFASVATAYVNNRIYKLNTNYTTSLWDQATGFSTFQESSNKSFVSTSSNGFNCLASNQNYLFYYDGSNLSAFNALTGAPVGNSYTVPGYSAKFQGGIYANSCDEVFVGGSGGNILKYHFDGTNFVPLTPLALAGFSTSAITDMVFNPANNLLYVCGLGLVAAVDPQSLCVDSVVSIQLQLTPACPDSEYVHILNPVSTSAYSFIWRDSLNNIISSVIAAPGVSVNGVGGLNGQTEYSVQVVQTAACQVISSTLHFNFVCTSQTVAHICHGASYQLPDGTWVTAPGIYTDTIPSSTPGVDSVITVNLFVYPKDSVHFNASICEHQTYQLPWGTLVNQTGTYIDTFTDRHGCDSIVAVHLQVYPLDTMPVNATVCQGQSYTLPSGISVSLAGTYYSTFPDMHGCDSVIETHLSYIYPTSAQQADAFCAGSLYTLPDGTSVSQPGIYTSVIPNAAGCDSTITTTLHSVLTPVISLGNDTTFCQGDELTLVAASPPSTYSWSTGSHDSAIVVQTSGTYTVWVSSPPCPVVSDSIRISVIDCSCIFMPNAFSPNDDGSNDGIKPIIACDFDLAPYEFCIYNRWGQLIFKTNDENARWDGTYKGANAEVGVYVYTISYFNARLQQSLQLKGNITLIR